MERFVFLVVLIAIGTGIPPALSKGYGCEVNLPDPVRRDCHPEAGANEEACRARDCVWCSEEVGGRNIPVCFFRNSSYVLPGPSCDNGYVPPSDRVDCSDGEEIREQGCRYKNCTWCPSTPDAGIPFCFVPAVQTANGYYMVGQPVTTPNGFRVNIIKSSTQEIKPQWEGEAYSLILEAEFQSDYRLRIKITDGSPRWEVPLEINPAQGGNANPLYDIEFANDPVFSFKVKRKSTNKIIFDSSAGKLVFSDQFLTLSWNLPSENVYGIGENEQKTFKHDFSQNLVWALWARDQPPSYLTNMYGVHPHYTVLEDDQGNTHAVVLVNSNAQEFHMLSGPKIKYITTGGIFDLYFFLGPTPENTVQQYTEAVGRAPLPPYWGLGFQLCKNGYGNIENMRAVVDRMESYGIPQDVQYGDIEIMDRTLDFTYSTSNFQGLPDFVKELHGRGMKFITILDPFISTGEPAGTYRPYDLGLEMDVWIKNGSGNGSPLLGHVWPEAAVHFPDYSKNSTREWWMLLIKEFHDLLEYDGLWIDMNEPANFADKNEYGCAPSTLENPPYLPKISEDRLSGKTVCADAIDSVSIHYNTHSMYGWFEAEPTLLGTRAGTGKRGLVLSRSTFLGSGKWTTHWLGDNWSEWSNLHHSIIGVMQFNQWGIPYVGPDICGFLNTATAPMCQRWQELGAFYPFSRNHANGGTDQDPSAWGDEIAQSSKRALEIRYTLLPYLYTLFYKHATQGNTVARALWHEFPTDSKTADIDRQFFWGSGLMISPVLDLGALSVQAYFPNARFYSYYDGSEVSTKGETTTLDAPMDFINLHIRGGNILPTQEPARNTEISRNNPLGLIVALDDVNKSEGALFYDDGDSLDTHLSGNYYYAEFVMSNGSLTSQIVTNGYAPMASKSLDTVRLLGAGFISNVTVNGVNTDFEKLSSGEVLLSNLNLNPTSPFTITFK